MNLTAFSVHHDGDGETLLVVESSDPIDDLLVPLSSAVAHVDACNVHATDGEGFKLVESARGGAHSADEFGAARAAEAVLLELSLRDGVDFDGGGIGGGGGGGPVVVGDEGFRGGGAEGEETASGGAWEGESGGRKVVMVVVVGNDGGWRSEETEVEGVGD